MKHRAIQLDSSNLLQGGGQQDSHELLRCLLGGLQAEEDKLQRQRFDADTVAAEAELQVRSSECQQAAFTLSSATSWIGTTAGIHPPCW